MIFRLLFIITLAPAVFLGLRRERDFQFVALVLCFSFAASFPAWDGNPIWNNAASDALFGGLIILFCRERIPLFIGGLFLFASSISIIYGICIQPEMGYARIYAHSLSVIGHIENLALIMGTLDVGLADIMGYFGRALGWPLRGGRIAWRRSFGAVDDGSEEG